MTCVFLLLMLFAMAAGEGRKPAQATSNSEVLSAESKEFVDYARDFLDMQTSYVDERLDSDIAGSLYEVANHNMERSGLLGSLVSVYEGTDCSKHHDEYRTLVNTEILTASKQIDLDIKAVQVGIADTAKPGLAAEARRMKNDLQGLKEKLEQIGKSLDQEQTATHQPGGPSWNAATLWRPPRSHAPRPDAPALQSSSSTRVYGVKKECECTL